RLGGKVEIDSVTGKGSPFRIKLPLTLAIIPSLLVSVGGERFAIPQVNVAELIRLRREQVKERIEIIGKAEVLRLRGKLIPIVHLANVLGLEKTYRGGNEAARPEDRRQDIADRRSERFGIHEAGPNPVIEVAQDRRSLEERRINSGSDMSIVVVTAGSL